MAVRVGDLEGRLRLNTAQWDRGMARMRSSVGRAEQSMQRVSAAVGVWGRRVGIAFAAASVASVKMAADFETSMTKIITLVGVAEKQVNEWRASVLRMAADTGKAPKELSDALFVVTSAGIRGAESLQVLEQAAKASAVGLGDTAAIARAVTSAVQAYGAENLSAQRAVEIMMATVREGNLEASSLASTLGRVIPIASQLGITFDNVGAFLATFTRLGVSSEEAVTALRGTLNLLLKPTTAATKALAEVGLSMADLRKVAKEEGLPEALGLIVDAFKGQDEQLALVIPNVRALAGVLGTAGAQGEQFAQILDSISNSTGIVDEGFERVQKTTAFAFNQMIANVKVLAIRIGTTLLPVATKILKWATELVKKAERWADVLDEQLPVIVAWGEFAVEAVKTTALAFAALVRIAFNVAHMIGDAFLIGANLLVGSMLKATETVIASWRALAVVGGTIFAPLGGAMELLADKFPDLEGKSKGFFDKAAEQAESFEKNLEDIGEAMLHVADGFNEMRLAAGRALETVARTAGAGAGAGVAPGPSVLQLPFAPRQLDVVALTARNLTKELTGFGKFLKKASIHLKQFGRSLVDVAREQLDPRMILSDLAAQGIAGIVGGILDQIGRMFEDPEGARIREALRANIEALVELRRSIDKQAAIVAGAPGGLLAGVREAGREAFAGPPGTKVNEVFGRFEAALKKLGLTMDDVRQVADILGLEFVASARGALDLLVALEQLSVSDLFASIAGQLDLMRRRFEIFDITDPVEQLTTTLAKFLEAADLGSAIENVLAGLDTSTAAGRQQLDDIIRMLFDQFEAGAITLSELGDLSATEFLDLLSQMEGLGDAVDGTTDGFRSLTRELSNVPRGFKIAFERFQATTGQRFPAARITDTSGRFIGQRFPNTRPQGGGAFQTVTAEGVMGGPGATSAGDQIINVDEVHIHPGPGQSGEQLWEEMAREVRRQARRGGTSNFDLALAQR